MIDSGRSDLEELLTEVDDRYRLTAEMEEYRRGVVKDLSIAVVGFGKMGLLHSTIISLLGAGSLRSVVDKSRALRYFAPKVMKNVSFFSGLDKMIAQEPDAVYVTTPVASHASILTRLLEQGVRNIFVEKPPTIDTEQLLQITDILGQNQIVMVGLQKRYAFTFRHAKSLLDNGIIGEPQRVISKIKSNDIGAKTGRFDSIERGVLLDLGIHIVDLLAWMLEIGEVVYSSQKSLYTRVDDVFEAVLRSKKGAMINLEVSWSDPEYRLPETQIEILGSHGTITVTEDFVRLHVDKDQTLAKMTGDACRYKPHYYQGVPPVNIADPEYTFENLHFLHCIHNRLEPETSMKAMVENMRVIDDMYSKAKEKT